MLGKQAEIWIDGKWLSEENNWSMLTVPKTEDGHGFTSFLLDLSGELGMIHDPEMLQRLSEYMWGPTDWVCFMSTVKDKGPQHLRLKIGDMETTVLAEYENDEHVSVQMTEDLLTWLKQALRQQGIDGKVTLTKDGYDVQFFASWEEGEAWQG